MFERAQAILKILMKAICHARKPGVSCKMLSMHLLSSALAKDATIQILTVLEMGNHEMRHICSGRVQPTGWQRVEIIKGDWLISSSTIVVFSSHVRDKIGSQDKAAMLHVKRF